MRPVPPRPALAAFALVAGLGLVGCGSAARASAPVTPRPAEPGAATVASVDPTAPEMVYLQLTDQGYRAHDIAAGLGRPVMFMVVNHGTRTHRLHASLPATSLQVVDPYATEQQPPLASATGFDVSVAPAHEVDVTLVPAVAGTFALAGDVMAGGAVVVR